VVCPVYQRESDWLGVAHGRTPKPIVDRFIPTLQSKKIGDQLCAEWPQLLEEAVTIAKSSLVPVCRHCQSGKAATSGNHRLQDQQLVQVQHEVRQVGRLLGDLRSLLNSSRSDDLPERYTPFDRLSVEW
jgi:hypothetical protein